VVLQLCHSGVTVVSQCCYSVIHMFSSRTPKLAAVPISVLDPDDTPVGALQSISANLMSRY
jgi:hypothetical protein